MHLPVGETTSDRRAGGSLKRSAGVSLGVAFSVFVFLWTQASMLLPGWTWGSFRTYFSEDELSDFAIAINAAHGTFSAVEPFTETGQLIDPHLYMEVIGAVSRITGLVPTASWTVVGSILEIILVGCASVCAARLTSRWWASLFGAVPFLFGTLSFSPGLWATGLANHAVLWGTFANMFSLNEVATSTAIA